MMVSSEETRRRSDLVAERLRGRGVAAYLAISPANLRYLTGFASEFLTSWRRHGSIAAIIDANEGSSGSLMVPDAEGSMAARLAQEYELFAFRTWQDTGSAADMTDPMRLEDRPVQFDEVEIGGNLRDMFAKHGLGATACVATDFSAMPLSEFEKLRGLFPGVEWVDFDSEMYDLRVIKSEAEVAALSAAAELAEMAMVRTVDQATLDMSVDELKASFFSSAAEMSITDPKFSGYSSAWLSLGTSNSSSYGSLGRTRASGGLQAGHLIKLDGGTVVDGYVSDSGRTFAFGVTPSAEVVRTHGLLRDSVNVGIEMLRPGVAFRDVYRAVMGHVHAGGLPGYSRGHVGHSVGMDTCIEEPPFFSPSEEAVVTEGMVLAIETPFYGADLGPMLTEEMVLITADGAELITRLPQDLRVVG